MKLGILGATGWIGSALGTRLIAQGLWPAGDLVLLNQSGRKGAYAGHPVVWAKDAADLCTQADVLVLSTRPEDFPVPGFNAGGKLVISFMTVWTLAKLRAVAPKARIVRAMPNGGAPVGQSYTPWIADAPSDADAAMVHRILSAIGQTDRLPNEAALDYMAALSGSGSAYPALMAKAMLEDALSRGIPPAIAARAVETVIVGSAGFLAGKMDGLDALLDSYHAYKGVTHAGLNAAEGAGFSAAVKAALAAATAKAESLGAS